MEFIQKKQIKNLNELCSFSSIFEFESIDIQVGSRASSFKNHPSAAVSPSYSLPTKVSD